MSDVFPTVLALDPGGTTGWSVICVHPQALVDPELSVLENVTYWQQGQYTGIEWEHVQEVEALADAWPDAAVVIEDFILRQFNQSRDLLSPVRLTAAIEYEMWKASRLVFRQQPADAKVTCTDQRLKSWGFYRSEGAQEHARDATRHALTFLRRCKDSARPGAKLRHAAWPELYDRGGLYIPEQELVEEVAEA